MGGPPHAQSGVVVVVVVPSVLKKWGGRRDLNPRQPDPQSGALTRLSYDHQQLATNVVFASAGVKRGPRRDPKSERRNQNEFRSPNSGVRILLVVVVRASSS